MTDKRPFPSALAILLVLVVGLGVVAGCGGSDTEAAGGSEAGDTPSGSFEVVREEFSLENYRGRPLLLNFWASW